MSPLIRTLIIAFLAAVGGVFVGRVVLEVGHHPRSDVHTFVHKQLDLDDNQKTKLDVLERQFAIRRTAIEMELRSDNALLAEAIEAEKGDGPGVNAAIDRSHQAMGRLQKETLTHIFAIRRLLRPDQAMKFDQAVAKALTDDGREP